MKKQTLKKAAAAFVLTAALALTPALAGCQGKNGRDGINGKDLTVYDLWQETKVQTGNPDLTYDEFLREYLSFSSEELDSASSLNASINRSLMSSVAIITAFDEYVRTGTFGSSQYAKREASYYGSGVILDVNRQSGDMIVVTNCHVVYSADARTNRESTAISTATGFAKSVKLWFYGSEYLDSNAIEASVIGASKNYDLAVLKISGNELVKNSQAVAAQWTGGEECFVGETVYAVGNADGKKIASSVGYISKDSEEVTVDMGSDSVEEAYTYRVLRTDTAINGGNSGGGLFNKYGELVGIVNAKTVSANIDNMGYALPAATSRRVVQNLIAQADGKYGTEVVSSGFTYAVADSYTTGLNKDNLAEIKEVVSVSKVSPFTTAYNKIKAGDVITNVTVKRGDAVIEDMRIDRLHNLTDALLSVRYNDTVIFGIERGGQKTEVSLTYSAADFARKA